MCLGDTRGTSVWQVALRSFPSTVYGKSDVTHGYSVARAKSPVWGRIPQKILGLSASLACAFVFTSLPILPLFPFLSGALSSP